MSDLNKGHRQRMRDRMLKDGLTGFQDHELLEMLLYQSIPRKDTNKIAHELLRTFGSFGNVIDATPQQLAMVKGVSEATACNLAMIKEAWSRWKVSKVQRKRLATVEEISEFVGQLISNEYVEKLVVAYLDANSKLVAQKVYSSNNSTEVVFNQQAVVADAIRLGARGMLFCHSHVDGGVVPSREDVQLTERMVIAFASLGIAVVDHVIFNNHGEQYSFYQHQLIQKIIEKHKNTII